MWAGDMRLPLCIELNTRHLAVEVPCGSRCCTSFFPAIHAESDRLHLRARETERGLASDTAEGQGARRGERLSLFGGGERDSRGNASAKKGNGGKSQRRCEGAKQEGDCNGRV